MKRLINIIMAVAVAIAAAIVPVEAAFDGQFLEDYPYILKDNLGFIYLSQEKLCVMPITNQPNSSNAKYIGLWADTSVLNDRDLIILYPINAEYIPQTEPIQYQAFTASNGNSYYLDPNTNTFTQYSTSSKLYIIPNYDLPGDYNNIFIKINVPNDFLNYAVTANYNPITEMQVGPDEFMPGYNEIYNVTVDRNLTLLDFIISDIENPDVEKIITELSIAIDQAVNNQTSTIISIGNQYIQMLPTSEAEQLESIQEQLSSIEDYVKDQSVSLQDKVKSEWDNIKSTAKQFPATIAPSATVVTNIITDIHEVMPPELQAAIIVIPLIIFIGWLIGKIA